MDGMSAGDKRRYMAELRPVWRGGKHGDLCFWAHDVAATPRTRAYAVNHYVMLNAAQTDTNGYVYVLQSGEYYKIGMATDYERRAKQIALQLPFPVSQVTFMPTDNMRHAEGLLHEMFKDKRKNGEWFTLNHHDLNVLKAADHIISLETYLSHRYGLENMAPINMSNLPF